MHTNGPDSVSSGSARAEKAAKQAAISSTSMIHQCLSTKPPEPVAVPAADIEEKSIEQEASINC